MTPGLPSRGRKCEWPVVKMQLATRNDPRPSCLYRKHPHVEIRRRMSLMPQQHNWKSDCYPGWLRACFLIAHLQPVNEKGGWSSAAPLLPVKTSQCIALGATRNDSRPALQWKQIKYAAQQHHGGWVLWLTACLPTTIKQPPNNTPNNPTKQQPHTQSTWRSHHYMSRSLHWSLSGGLMCACPQKV